MPPPSVVDARQFFRRMYSGVDAGFIEIRPLLDSSDSRRGTPRGASVEARARRWFRWPKGLDACVSYCRSISGRDLHVYFGVGLRKRDGGGTKADVGCLTALFADVDFKDVPEAAAVAALKSFRFRPSACVRSGNGVHAYWFLDSPVFGDGLQELERVNRAILVALGAQVGPQNADRLLRVPGTANIKAKYPDPKPIAEVSWWSPEIRHALAGFSAAFPASPDVPEPPRRAARVPRPPDPAATVPERALADMARILAGLWIVGCRHYLALHIGGWCAHAGLDEGSALRLMDLVCQAASDEEESDRLEAVADSYRKFASGVPVAGLPGLLKFIVTSFPAISVGRAAAVVEAARARMPARAPVCIVSPEDS